MNANGTRGLALGVALCGLWGCAAAGAGSDDTTASTPTAATAVSAAPVTPPSPPAVTTVTVRGQVVSASGAGLGNAQVFWLPSDPYLVPMQSTQTDAAGSFLLGVSGDARDWLLLEQTGYQSLFQAFDLTNASPQSLPATTLPTNADATALAQSFGVTLDPTRIVMRIPVTVAAPGGTTPAVVGDFTVSTQPALDVPVQYASGEAIVFNALASGPYQVTVTRSASTCAPAAHPQLVAADGSVLVGTLSGFWSVGPTMVCP